MLKNKSDFSKLLKVSVKLFLLDISFLFFLSFFLVLAREKMLSYVSTLEQLGGVVSGVVDLEGNADIVKLTEFIDTANPLIWKYKFLLYLAVPLIIFLLYCLTNGLGWWLINKNKQKISWKRYIVYFTMINIPAFLILYGIFYKILNILSSFVPGFEAIIDFNYEEQIILILILLFFVVSYLALIYYNTITDGLKKGFKSAVLISLKKIHIILPIYLLILVLVLALIITLLYLLVGLIAGSLIWQALLLGLLLLLGLIGLKILFTSQI